MILFRSRTIFLFLVLLFHCKALKSQDVVAPIYKCPPCGCSSDRLTFSNSGDCNSCSMELYLVNQNIKKLNDVISPLLQNSSLQFFNKLIYPSYIIGILLGFAALFSVRGKRFNPFLAMLVLTLALYGFKNQLYGVSYGLTTNFRMIFVPISFILAIGPMVYFYTKSITENVFIWSNRYLLHFIPALTLFVFSLVLLFVSDDIKREFMYSSFETSYGHLEQFAAILITLPYLYFSFLIYKRFKSKDAKHEYILKWLKRFFMGILITIVMWLSLMTINLFMYNMGVATVTYNPLWLIFSLVLYWVFIEIMLNPRMFFAYRNFISNRSIENLHEDKSRLTCMMDEAKPYLDTDLTLEKLALLVDMNPKHLSRVINNGFNKNFYEFVNDFRLEEVKKLLLDKKLKHLTIAAIANQAGFKSKSSFNTLFKKSTTLTPKEYLKSKEAEN